MSTPSLILVPGLAGDAAMWRGPMQMLRPYRPVVTDAQTKHGTIEAMAAGLLEQHPGPLVVCGVSMGGSIAMEAVRQAPERIIGLALLATIPHPETPQMRRVRGDAIGLFRQGRIREVIEGNLALAFHSSQAGALAADYLDFVQRAGAGQLVRQNEAVMARPDARLHLPKVRCPVLVVCGDSDLLAPPGASREIATLVPHARLEIVRNCGHMLTMEQPERIGELLLDWLRTLPG